MNLLQLLAVLLIVMWLAGMVVFSVPEVAHGLLVIVIVLIVIQILPGKKLF